MLNTHFEQSGLSVDATCGFRSVAPSPHLLTSRPGRGRSLQIVNSACCPTGSLRCPVGSARPTSGMGATQHGTQATQAAQIGNTQHGKFTCSGSACAAATPGKFSGRAAPDVHWAARDARRRIVTSGLAKRRSASDGQCREGLRTRPSRSRSAGNFARPRHHRAVAADGSRNLELARAAISPAELARAARPVSNRQPRELRG